MKPLAATVLAAILLLVGLSAAPWKKESAQREVPEARPNTETAVFSGGCFWGLQAAFNELPGVVGSRVGYTGGTTLNPTYSKVVAGITGHAEAVEVIFDPYRISYARLVQFHLEHVRRAEGEPDAEYATKHYRSSVFVLDEEQRANAEEQVARFTRSNPGDTASPVLIEDATAFWEAEAEHQNYLANCAY